MNIVAADCGFARLAHLDAGAVEHWFNRQTDAGAGARNRNCTRSALVTFGNWAVRAGRLTVNPFALLPTANERADRRRQRRAMTAAELTRLLHVARLRPVADFGRGTVAKPAAEQRGRSTWRLDDLTFDTIDAAAAAGRDKLAENPAFLAERERLGRERALIYKTMVLTGLRKNELASLTVGQCRLDGPTPCIELNAADEKNRRGGYAAVAG